MSNIDITTPERQLANEMQRLLSLKDVDCRKQGAAKRVRTFARRLAADLGNDLSFAEQQLAMRCAMLAALLEDHEARALQGQKISLADYIAMASVQKQLLLALGLRRRPRDITPTLDEYLEQREAAE